MPKNKGRPYLSAAKYLALLIAPHKKLYILASVMIVIAVGAGLLNAKVTQMLIDSAVKGNMTLLTKNAGLFAVIIAANLITDYIGGVSAVKLSALATRDMKRNVASSLINARYANVMELRAGDALSAVNLDTQIVSDFLASDLTGLLSQALKAFGAFCYLLLVDPLMTLITFAYTPVGMLITLKLSGIMRCLHPVRSERLGQSMSLIEQGLGQLPVIKSFLMEYKLRRKVEAACNGVLETEMKISYYNALMQPACSSVAMIPRFMYMIFAGLTVISGGMSIGGFIAMLDLLGAVIGPTVYFPFMLNSLNKAVASMNRVKNLGELARAILPDCKAEASDCPGIEINDLSFRYKEGGLIYDGLSFSYKRTGLVAIKGKSGKGKTTLLDLISGLLVPEGGEIRVDGRISVMDQESFLFSGAITENVRLGNLSATDREITEAMRKANAEGFSVDCVKGDGGNRLSGGQRQRVSLARTLLSDASIWLLDEPTSALDEDTERIILKTLEEEKSRRLIIAAAHRSSIFEIADIVIDLDTEGGDGCEAVSKL